VSNEFKNRKNMKTILAVLVNYGLEQVSYLEQVVAGLKSFEKYKVTIIINSNVPLNIPNVDKVNILTLNDYQLLPLTCRKVLWENRDDFDVFIYGENDHLFLEKHVDNHLEYSKIIPKNRISGLIQYEEDNNKEMFYPAYHCDFEWDFNSVEVYNGKKFAHFNNLHQATFILTKYQLLKVGKKINFEELMTKKSFLYKLERKIKTILKLTVEKEDKYSVKCKVNTDVFEFGGMKKLICITDFEDNLIHHLPNLYIDGNKGRNKFRSDSARMNRSLKKMLD
jgi:hypothetical protein